LLAGHPRVRPDWLRPIVGELATLLLRPVDPVEHLPHLTGRFLLLGGRADELIPKAAADRMRAVTPEPKTVVLFTGDHMGVGPGQMELLERIVRTSTEWLIEMGAVNPPTRS
jgi:pimeloyl-ACP methyl ester carboxylesterase